MTKSNIAGMPKQIRAQIDRLFDAQQAVEIRRVEHRNQPDYAAQRDSELGTATHALQDARHSLCTAYDKCLLAIRQNVDA